MLRVLRFELRQHRVIACLLGGVVRLHVALVAVFLALVIQPRFGIGFPFGLCGCDLLGAVLGAFLFAHRLILAHFCAPCATTTRATRTTAMSEAQAAIAVLSPRRADLITDMARSCVLRLTV